VLGVEDWAEIRRLRRAEWMPIKQIARVMGVSKNTVKRALAAEGHHLPAGAAGVDRGPGGAAHRGAAWGVADDARDGDRRAGRLDPGVDGAQAAGAGVDGRPTCHRTQRRGRHMPLARSLGVTCGFPMSRCRWGSGRPGRPAGCRCW
jgi:hypothetical protein